MIIELFKTFTWQLENLCVELQHLINFNNVDNNMVHFEGHNLLPADCPINLGAWHIQNHAPWPVSNSYFGSKIRFAYIWRSSLPLKVIRRPTCQFHPTAIHPLLGSSAEPQPRAERHIGSPAPRRKRNHSRRAGPVDAGEDRRPSLQKRSKKTRRPEGKHASVRRRP